MVKPARFFHNAFFMYGQPASMARWVGLVKLGPNRFDVFVSAVNDFNGLIEREKEGRSGIPSLRENVDFSR